MRLPRAMGLSTTLSIIKDNSMKKKKSKKWKKKDPTKRSTVFNLSCNDDVYEKVLTSIRFHRAIVRKIYTTYTIAAMAGSEFKWEKDKFTVEQKGTEKILEHLFNGKKDDNPPMYQIRPWVREELAPTWFSHTWDSARTCAVKSWTAKDPEITNVSRGWLVTQGARQIARFNHIGIELPVMSSRPQLQGHSLILKWDKEIGPVEFRVGRLEGSRFQVWEALRDKREGWILGTIFLNEHEGKIKATITYTKPLKSADVDPSQVLDVEFTDDPANFITCYTKSNVFKADKISVEEAVGWLQAVQISSQKQSAERKAVGNPYKRWGSKKLWKGSIQRLKRVTLRRTNGQQTRSHLWTRRIVEHALRARCGVIHVLNMPEKTLFGHPWAWSQFQNFLDYKAAEQGIRLVVDYQRNEKDPEYCPKCGGAFIPVDNRQKYDRPACRCGDHNSRKRYFPNFGKHTKAKYTNRVAKVSLREFRKEVSEAI